MRVLHVCSELFPILKTGGLADVAAALPPALSSLGVQNRVLVPGFPAFMESISNKKIVTKIQTPFSSEEVVIYITKIPGTKVDMYVINSDELYNRPGNPYMDSYNKEYQDNYKRFALLGWLAAKLAVDLDPKWSPDIVHGHDWHAGLVPAYLKAIELETGKKVARSVFTVHNLAYQGLFPIRLFPELQLPEKFLDVEGVEFYGQISFLKAGLQFADKITTVSPTYAKEIQTQAQGCGLDGLLSSRKGDLYGVLNGVDPKVWSPKSDEYIKAQYNAKTVVTGKPKCKIALQQMTGLKVQNAAPVFGVVSRLTEQKGFHILTMGMGEILNRGGQVVILGSGDTQLEDGFKSLADQYPKQVAVQIGYDEEQAHRIIAGCDVILVPSRFEPCGLTQLYGLAYGTLPLVHNVGGLADTVTDCSLENIADNLATGFVFNNFTVEDFVLAVKRAFALYDRRTDWKKVRNKGMTQKNDWKNAAQQMLEIYQKAL